jgi:hypothetical protein
MEEGRKSSLQWFTIKDKSLIMLILQSYADPDKKKILDATERPRMILDIIEACKLPQTSTYRKINLLIRNGLLIPTGQVSMKYGKNVTTYVTLFKSVEINIIKNDVQVRAKISEDSKNAILRMMREKIINSKKFSVDAGKDLSDAIHQSFQKSGTKSVVPYLLKERIIKV